MPRRHPLVLAAAVGLAGTLLHVPPAAATTYPPVRVQAETGTLGGTCGDGQAQSVYTLATGETVVFLGGGSCAITFGSTIDEGAVAVRWFGGGHNGAVCGRFATVRNGTQVATTGRTCSTAGATSPDWQVATLPRHAMAPGQFQLVWVPETAWHDAHVDWVDLDDYLVVRQAESSTFSGSCDGQPVAAHPAPTGETVVTLGGTGCTLQFGTAGPNWVFEVRWYGDDYANQICGHFSARYFSTEFGRTKRTCSVGGGLPDWEVAAFSVNDMPSFFHLVWVPEVAWHDANVDWVSTGWTNGGEAVSELTPAAYDFGMRAVGSNTDRGFTLKNLGDGPMYVSQSDMWLGHLGTVFTIPVDNCVGKVVWPGQSCTVVVRFNPQWASRVEEYVRVQASGGMVWSDVAGDADEYDPESAITTANGAVIPSTGTVAGTATDERSGINVVKVTFTDLAGYATTVTATTTCSNTSRLSCSWSAPVPLAPGRYTVNSRAWDRVGHQETPGPSVTVTVV